MGEQPAKLMPQRDAPSNLGGRIAAVIALVLLLGVTLLQAYRAAGGESWRNEPFPYTEDAAYQQLIIGRELAAGTERGPEHDRRTTPLAASASPAWSMLMAVLVGTPAVSADAAQGAARITRIPLLVNLAFAALLVAVAGHLVCDEVRSGLWMLGFLLAMGLLVPLVPLVMTGTEHVAHMMVVLLAVAVGLRTLDHPEVPIAMTLLAALLAAVGVAVRSESLAIVLGLLAWAWVQRRTGRGLVPLAAAVIVVVATALYLRAHGGLVAPNPVLLHAGAVFEGGWRHWPESVFEQARRNLATTTLPWALLAMGVVLLASSRAKTHAADPLERRRVGWLFVFVFCGLAHLLFGQTSEHGFRHAAYLVPLGMVAIARVIGAAYQQDRAHLAPTSAGVGPSERAEVLAAPDAGRAWPRGIALLVLVCAAPVALLGAAELGAFRQAPQRAQDAVIRNRLAATFVRTYFTRRPVATNQTGTIAFQSQARLIDLSGTTNGSIARARCEGTYTADVAAREVSNAQAPLILLLGEAAYVPVPASWEAVGGWRSADRPNDPSSMVRVYAASEAMEIEVRLALRLFSEQRHEGVRFWFAEDGSLPPTRPELTMDKSADPGDGRLACLAGDMRGW